MAKSLAAALQVKTKFFRGLADQSRLTILEALRGGPKNVSQVAETGFSQPSVSMHLDCLWCCGLVDREVGRRFTHYRIKSHKVIHLLEMAEAVLEDVSDRIACCARYRPAKKSRGPAT
jgi:ArsR family transcriptional regulator, cadmium/lead-responsive transcriptional repressor